MTTISGPADHTAWFDHGSADPTGLVFVRADDAALSDGERRWYTVANSPVCRRFLGEGFIDDAREPDRWGEIEPAVHAPASHSPMKQAPAEFVDWVLDQVGRKP